MIAGSEDFAQQHLAGVEWSSEIPAVHLRPPRPSLAQILAGRGYDEAIAAAYGHGYTMPAIAQQLGLHPSTGGRAAAVHRSRPDIGYVTPVMHTRRRVRTVDSVLPKDLYGGRSRAAAR